MPELLATIVEHLPELIAGLVFLYALITLLLSTFHLITRMRQARARLTEVATRDQLLAIFAQTGLKLRLPELVDTFAKLRGERKGVEWARDGVILRMSSSRKR